LSLSVVDEAAFYVSENRPGLLKQFFLADEELLKPAYQIAFAISPAKLLGGEDKYQNLAAALFSAPVEVRVDTSILDTLVQESYLSPLMVERIRENLQAGRYDRLLREAPYAHLAGLLMPGGDYTLRATTYHDKIAQAEAFRERYFEILKTVFIVLIVAGSALCVLGALSYSTIRLIWARKAEGLNPIKAAVHRVTNGIVHSYALLLFFPVITYLSGLFLGGFLDVYIYEAASVLWGVFVINAVLAALLIILQFKWSLALTHFPETAPLVGRMIILPVLFVIQYIVSRMIILAYVPRGMDEGLAFLVAVASSLFTLIMYFVASAIAGSVALRHKVELRRPRGVLGAATVISICVLLGSLLTPFGGRVRELAMATVALTDLAGVEKALIVSGGLPGEVARREYPDSEAIRAEKAPPRVRRYFPETLLWYPELITDDKGEATLDLITADSITTWRMNVDAVSAAGRLGNSEVGIRVFQDFFVDLDLPVALTRNDEVSIPILCYNYLRQPQTVELELQAGPWCNLQGPSVQELNLGANEVKSAMFRIKAEEVGSHELTLVARGDRVSDAVQRRVDVRPDGQEIEDLQNGVLALCADHIFYVPPEAIPNSQSLILKLYPSTFSEVVEGLENIFRMPYGCFEQTSSTTYPNVMALLYMKQTKQVTPEIEVKARKFVTAGYQRLLTFEVAGGGFDWFGHAPANETLTAYGILEFTDMAKVHNVDPAVIDRASRWLASRQNSGGSWNPPNFTGTVNAVEGTLRSTAYITWALAEAGRRGAEVDEALDFLRRHLKSTEQAYTISLAANAFLTCDRRDSFGKELVAWLRPKFQSESDSAHISSTGAGAMYSRGHCLDIETTALATLAMIKANRHPDLVKRSLAWISEQKDQYGTWHSTQATILAMKALIAGTGQVLSSDAPAKIDVSVNGQAAGGVTITPDTGDVVHMIVLTDYLQVGENNINIKQDEQVEIPYRLVGTFWVPTKAPTIAPEKELEIQVDYGRARLAVDDTLMCNVEVKRNGDTPVGMAIIDLGIPPGFRVDASGFESLVESKTLAKYEVTGNQCILYVRSIEPGRPIRFSYELRALYPIRATIPPSKVYEYYKPENRDQTLGREIIVEETGSEGR
jgi:hypothetical protein